MKHLEVMDFLEQQFALPRRLRNTLSPLFIEERYKKNQILHSPSDRSRKIWYVQSGYLCLYHYDGESRVSEIYKRGSFILFCFTDERKDSYLKVLADCVVTTIEYRSLLPFFHGGLISPEVEKRILINEINRKIRAARSAKSPAQNRLRQLMSEIPEIFLVASYDEISSYLKISRETLRKLRNSL